MSTTETSDPLPNVDVASQKDTNSFVPALMVIDMQNDFVYGSLAVKGGETIIDSINELIDLPWKIKIATRDFHPDNHVSFAKAHSKPEFSKKIVFHPEDKDEALGKEQIMWPVHCVAYTDGADFVPGLKSTAFNVVIHKGTHPHIESYSAFKDIWGKNTTELYDIVQAEGITDIFLVGLAGDYCVKYTAIDSIEYGFRTWLITDGIKSVNSEDLSFEELVNNGARLTNSKEVNERFSPPKPQLNRPSHLKSIIGDSL